MSPKWIVICRQKILHLRIEKSNITTISPETFESPVFSRLAILELADLRITSITGTSFTSLRFLEILKLEQLEIESIPSTLLESVPLLKNLFVFNCGLQLMNVSQMSNSTCSKRLTVIEFKKNNLGRTIGAGTFTGMHHLISLDLSANKIESIGYLALSALPETLEKLNLSNNNLKTMPMDLNALVRRASKPLRIILQNNPWECNCFLESFRYLLTDYHNIFDHQFIRCSSPPQYQSQLIASLSNFCRVYIATTAQPQAMLGSSHLKTAASIELACAIFSAPHPQQSNVTIKRPMQNIRVEKSVDGEYSLIISEMPSDHYLLGFENNEPIIEDSNKLRRSPRIPNEQSFETNNVRISPEVKADQIYQFCLMRKELTEMSPYSCVSFHTRLRVERNRLTCECFAMFTSLWVIGAAIAIIAGVFLTFVVVKTLSPSSIYSVPEKNENVKESRITDNKM